MACMCLTCAHTILIGLVLILREKKERRKGEPSPTWVAATGTVCCRTFGTFQRVILARVPQLPPKNFICLQGANGKGIRERGSYLESPHRGHQAVMVCMRAGKEFPGIMQNERRPEFIRVGDAVREASLVAQMVKNLPAMQGDLGSVPESGRSPVKGNG